MVMKPETTAVKLQETPTSPVRKATVVDLNVGLPTVVSPHRHQHPEETTHTPARCSLSPPQGRRAHGKSDGSRNGMHGVAIFPLVQDSPLIRTPAAQSWGAQIPHVTSLSSPHAFSRGRHAPSAVNRRHGGSGEEEDGWNGESFTTRVLRVPHERGNQPCNIKAIQIRDSRIVTMAPNALRFWQLALEDNCSSGLLFDMAPPAFSTDQVDTALSKDSLQKISEGYAAFLERIGDVQVDGEGAMSSSDLATSEAMRCLKLTADENERLISKILNLPSNTVTSSDLILYLADLCRQVHGLSPALLSEPKKGAEAGVVWTAFDSTDAVVAAGTSIGTIHILRLDDTSELCRFHETMAPRNGFDIPARRRSPVTTVKLVAQSTVISGSRDGIIRLWDIGMHVCLWYCQGHIGPVLAMDACAYPNLGSIASEQDTVPRIWRVDRFDPYMSDRGLCLHGHEGNVLCLGFTPDGEILATGGVDATVRIWRTDDAYCLMVFRQGFQAITCVSVTHDLIASGSKDASIHVWDVKNLRPHFTLGGHAMAITALDVKNDKLISSSEDGYTNVCRLWNHGTTNFSINNSGIRNVEPDAQKNVPEQVVLQTVQGDNIITKTLFGYPALRTFNTSSRHFARRNGPCGFITGSHAEVGHGSPIISPPPPPNTARDSVAHYLVEVEELSSSGPLTNLMSDHVVMEQSGRTERLQVVGADRIGTLDTSQDKAKKNEDVRLSKTPSHFNERSTSRSEERRLPTAVDPMEEGFGMAGPDDLTPMKLAWGRRQIATASSTATSRKRMDSRQRLHNVGLHLGAKALQQQSQRNPRMQNMFHVAGDRDQTVTDDPNFRAWKHKWMRARGAVDPRVDGALQHADLIHKTLINNQSFLLPLDYDRLAHLKATSGRSSLNSLPRLHTTKPQLVRSRDFTTKMSASALSRARTSMS